MQAAAVDVKRIPSKTIVPVGGFLIRNLSKLQSYGDIVHVKLGVTDFHLVMNSEMIQQVLVTKQRDFIKGVFLQKTKKVFGEGLLTSEGDLHHRQRRLVQPAFHHDRIAAYASVMTEYAKDTMSGWRNGETLDVHAEMNRLTMRVVAKCLFDADIEAESKSLAGDLTLMIDYFTRLSSTFSRVLERLPSNRKYQIALKRIDKMVYDLIETRRASGKDEDGDLLSLLLRARDEGGVQMSDKQLRDEVLILFAAGHETTANALTWTWYLLSQNPGAEEKLHYEVEGVLGGRLPTASDLPRLEYVTRVFTESMRLYPPAWILVRQAVNDTVIGGYQIPKGSNVVVSQFVNHRDPRYFRDPLDFNPDRWTPEMKNALPKFAYFPFGGGPRSCVGEPFAWMEGVLLLATIARKWRMEHAEGHRVEMFPRITLRPRYGMRMKLTAR